MAEDAFRRAVASATRALARERALNVVFRTEDSEARHTPNPSATKRVVIPVPKTALRSREIARIRGSADAAALRLRYHDPKEHASKRPTGDPARTIFDVMEQARVEAIGAETFSGVRANLDADLDAQCRRGKLDWVETAEDAPLGDVVRLVLREWLTGSPPPKAAQHAVDLWRPWFSEHLADGQHEVRSLVNDQRAFAAWSLDLIERLPILKDTPPTRLERTVQRPERVQEPSPKRLRRQDDRPEIGVRQRWERKPKLTPSQTRALNDEGEQYRVFTRQYDEVVDAHRLTSAEELDRLRRRLSLLLRKLGGGTSHLANRLQRLLMARQSRSWEFDMDVGLLDSGRLARVIVSPDRPLSFKREREADFPDTIVTILVDNSGSMRGVPITTAALCTDILGRTLERCGVKVEVLGFTTRAWKGGGARQLWVAAGRPARPGRLNDVRHIIYKDAAHPWRRAHRNIGVMLHPDLLKENIDGEALIWAHSRLLARPEARRILMVISDGAPVDDSTASANDRLFLEKHLRAVITALEAYSPVELVAIGIGHDVTRYYRRSMTIAGPESLGAAMVHELSELLSR